MRRLFLHDICRFCFFAAMMMLFRLSDMMALYDIFFAFLSLAPMILFTSCLFSSSRCHISFAAHADAQQLIRRSIRFIDIFDVSSPRLMIFHCLCYFAILKMAFSPPFMFSYLRSASFLITRVILPQAEKHDMPSLMLLSSR